MPAAEGQQLLLDGCARAPDRPGLGRRGPRATRCWRGRARAASLCARWASPARPTLPADAVCLAGPVGAHGNVSYSATYAARVAHGATSARV